MDQAPDALPPNRALWDTRARLHGTTETDAFYDVAAFLAGADTLYPLEVELAGDVGGADLLHLQCHFGMDTLSWARRGAHVTGVDFSPVALARAADLAARTGLPARWVEADTEDLPAELAGRFDVVIATYGVLCWIGDTDAWMRGAAAALRPGGRLVLVDVHPAFLMVAGVDPLVVDWPYGGGMAQRSTTAGSYADPDLPTGTHETVEYPHSLGEVVTACAGAGLRVDRLGEHLETHLDCRQLLTPGPDGLYRFPFGDSHLPILYSLRAFADPG